MTREELERENETLRDRLREAEETLRAIREGRVDAIVVESEAGTQVFSLTGAETVYRLAVETMHEAAINVAPDGTILFCNSRFAEFVATPQEQLAGRHLADFVPPTEREALRSLLARCARQEISQRVLLRSADGLLRPTQLSGNALLRGNQLTYCLVAADLSELENAAHQMEQLRQAQAALRESETRMQQALNVSRSFTFEWLPVTDEVLRSASCGSILHLDGDEVLHDTGKRYFQRVHPDDRARFVGMLRELKPTRPGYETEYRILSGDGSITTLEETARATFDDDGNLVHLVGVSTDITARKQAQTALLQSEQRFRNMADSMPQLVWTARRDGMVDYFNSRASIFAGFSQRPDGTWIWEPVIHPDDAGATLSAWRSAVATGQRYEIEHRIRMADGSVRWHLSRANLIDVGDHAQWFGTATDIDDIKRAEAALREFNAELELRVQERTEQLRRSVQELEAFSYSVAHDMRAPLRAMAGFAKILNDEYGEKLDAEGRHYLELIVRGARRQDRFITDVLDYTRVMREKAALAPVDLDLLLGDIFMHYPQLEEHAGCIQISYPLGKVMGNEALLTQVITNLVGNAIKFAAPDREPRVVLRTETGEDGSVRLWVEDNGIGIAPEYQQRIFDMFARLHSGESGGTGIGLAIVHAAAQRMGGEVGVMSAVGEGSRFWVRLVPAGETKDPL